MILFVQTMTNDTSVYEEPICSRLASLSSKLVSVPLPPPPHPPASPLPPTASFQTDCPIWPFQLTIITCLFVSFIKSIRTSVVVSLLVLLLFVCFLLPDFFLCFLTFLHFLSFLLLLFLPSGAFCICFSP